MVLVALLLPQSAFATIKKNLENTLNSNSGQFCVFMPPLFLISSATLASVKHTFPPPPSHCSKAFTFKRPRSEFRIQWFNVTHRLLAACGEIVKKTHWPECLIGTRHQRLTPRMLLKTQGRAAMIIGKCNHKHQTRLITRLHLRIREGRVSRWRHIGSNAPENNMKKIYWSAIQHLSVFFPLLLL